MNETQVVDFGALRKAIANFELSSSVKPNTVIQLDHAFFPDGHRGVLDLKRQLVVGNRGMGKSFWTHALLNTELRERLAVSYGYPTLAKADVVIGFNGSEKVNNITPTVDEIEQLYKLNIAPEIIWRGVFLRASLYVLGRPTNQPLKDIIKILSETPEIYSQTLTEADTQLATKGKTLVVVFDALDKLANDWDSIRALTKGLLIRALGLHSFQSIRAKIFMRVDQFSDANLFNFPDSSKIKNDHVNLAWRPHELYGLLLFEILRNNKGEPALRILAEQLNALVALPENGKDNSTSNRGQVDIINAISGEFMGNNEKRGRVYTWVPLHLSDVSNNCSPRTFLTAWKTAAEHIPAPVDKAIDHLGLIEGVRKASTSRLQELYEDYSWIQPTLEALRRQFIPITKDALFGIWTEKEVGKTILSSSSHGPSNVPVGFIEAGQTTVLLDVMKSVAVMEERSNGKINIPDIFRVEAGILRKGGVSVPRRN